MPAKCAHSLAPPHALRHIIHNVHRTAQNIKSKRFCKCCSVVRAYTVVRRCGPTFNCFASNVIKTVVITQSQRSHGTNRNRVRALTFYLWQQSSATESSCVANLVPPLDIPEGHKVKCFIFYFHVSFHCVTHQFSNRFVFCTEYFVEK